METRMKNSMRKQYGALTEGLHVMQSYLAQDRASQRWANQPPSQGAAQLALMSRSARNMASLRSQQGEGNNSRLSTSMSNTGSGLERPHRNVLGPFMETTANGKSTISSPALYRNIAAGSGKPNAMKRQSRDGQVDSDSVRRSETKVRLDRHQQAAGSMVGRGTVVGERSGSSKNSLGSVGASSQPLKEADPSGRTCCMSPGAKKLLKAGIPHNEKLCRAARSESNGPQETTTTADPCETSPPGNRHCVEDQKEIGERPTTDDERKTEGELPHSSVDLEVTANEPLSAMTPPLIDSVSAVDQHSVVGSIEEDRYSDTGHGDSPILSPTRRKKAGAIPDFIREARNPIYPLATVSSTVDSIRAPLMLLGRGGMFMPVNSHVPPPSVTPQAWKSHDGPTSGRYLAVVERNGVESGRTHGRASSQEVATLRVASGSRANTTPTPERPVSARIYPQSPGSHHPKAPSVVSLRLPKQVRDSNYTTLKIDTSGSTPTSSRSSTSSHTQDNGQVLFRVPCTARRDPVEKKRKAKHRQSRKALEESAAAVEAVRQSNQPPVDNIFRRTKGDADSLTSYLRIIPPGFQLPPGQDGATPRSRLENYVKLGADKRIYITFCQSVQSDLTSLAPQEPDGSIRGAGMRRQEANNKCISKFCTNPIIIP